MLPRRHVVERGLGAMEGPLHIDIEDEREVRFRDVLQRGRSAEGATREGHEVIDPTVLGGDLLESPIHGCPVCHVTRVPGGPPAGEPLGRRTCSRQVDVDEGHRGTRSGKSGTQRTADPAGAAGDDDDLSCKS